MKKWKEARGIKNKNENKVPLPPCGERHSGQCRLSPECGFRIQSDKRWSAYLVERVTTLRDRSLGVREIPNFDPGCRVWFEDEFDDCYVIVEGTPS